MLKTKITFALLLIAISLQAQEQSVVTVTVFSLANSRTIPGVSIRIVNPENNNDIYNFAFTNASGTVTLRIPVTSFCIKSTSLNFIDSITCFKNITTDTLKIYLRSRITTLDNVTVNARVIYSKINSDTISYNLKSVTDGSEKNIGEALRKLPGVSVDKNGKVFYQGKKVDQVNVDGNSLFGNMQQLITQNLDADVVSKVDIYRQKKESALGSEKLILDLRIGAKYKNRIIANAKVEGGMLSKYALNGNLFRFKKHGNISLLNSANNIGNSPLTLEDYLDILYPASEQEAGAQFAGGDARVIDNNDLPKFLFSDNKLLSSKNIFSAFSLSDSLGKKTGYQFFALYNLPVQRESLITEYSSLTNTNINRELTAKRNELPLGLLDLKSATALTAKSRLYYSLKMNNTTERNNADFFNTLSGGNLSVISDVKNTKSVINTVVTFQQNLSLLSSIAIFARFKKSEQLRMLSISSNQILYPELYSSGGKSLVLENRFENKEVEAGINYGRKGRLPLFLSLNVKKEINENAQTMPADKIFMLSGKNRRASVNESIATNRNLFKTLSFNTSLTLHQYFHTFTDSAVAKDFYNVLDFRTGLGFITKNLNRINLSFNQTSSFTGLSAQYNNIYIDSYRDLFFNLPLNANKPNTERTVSLSFMSVKALKAKNTYALISLINGKNKVVVFPEVYPKFVLNTSYYSPNYNGYNAYLNDDRNFIRQLVVSKLNISLYSLKMNYFFNNKASTTKLKVVSARHSLISHFSKSKFQFEYATDFKYSRYSFTAITKLIELQPGLTLKWNEKTVFYECSIKKLFQFSNYFQSNGIFNAGFSIRKKFRKNIEVSFTGDNVFNLRSQSIYSVYQNNIVQTIAKIETLPGSLLAGIRYNF